MSELSSLLDRVLSDLVEINAKLDRIAAQRTYEQMEMDLVYAQHAEKLLERAPLDAIEECASAFTQWYDPWRVGADPQAATKVYVWLSELRSLVAEAAVWERLSDEAMSEFEEALKADAARYPTRARIVDVAGAEVFPGVLGNTPDVSKPHVGKFGLAEQMDNGLVRITLDDGAVIWGHQCWWVPVEKQDNAEPAADGV